MAYEKLVFSELPWRAGPHPLERKKCGAFESPRLLEFAPGFADPNWCESGHEAFVLQGQLALEFEAGRLVVEAGQGFVIEAGTRHRASNPGDVAVRLFISRRV